MRIGMWALFLLAAACAPAPAQVTQSAAVPHASPRQVVEALFEAFNRHDIGAMVALYAADARLTSSDFCAPRLGPEGVRQTYSELFAAFPDVVDNVETIITEGQRVAVRFTSQSRMPGREFTLPIMTFLTIVDGRIQSDDTIFDNRGRPCSA